MNKDELEYEQVSLDLGEKKMEQSKAESILEAILFTMGEAVEISRLADVIEMDEKSARKILEYKQPVTRVEIERIRGVSCDHAINRLLEYDLICELGRLDAPGRPLLFGTTEQFLRSFGVSSIEDLPEINPVQVEEFKQQAEAEVQLQLDV